MNDISTGGPAFPDSEGQHDYTGGATLLDYFAGFAMQGMLSNSEIVDHVDAPKRIAEHAYKQAVEMLKSRQEVIK